MLKFSYFMLSKMLAFWISRIIIRFLILRF